MKKIEEIYQELKQDFAARSGLEPLDSCDLAVRLWAVAAQIQALGVQAEWVLNQSFPQTAEGVCLDRHADMRGISRFAAAKAVGRIRFFVKNAMTEAVTIAAGTVCMTADERRFQTLEAAVLQPGDLYAEAAAEAMEGGSGGNATAGAVCILTACPVSVTGCTNPEAFSGGSDEESDEALRSRILESYRRLPNGANAAWYEATAMSHSGVVAAKAIGRARGIGTVDVCIASEAGIPTEEVLAEVKADLQARREIAVDVQVVVPAVQMVNVSVELAVRDGAEFAQVKSAAEQVVIGFFGGDLLGRPVRLAELGHLLYSVEGVENYRILSPAEDVGGADTVLPMLGTLNIAEMEA